MVCDKVAKLRFWYGLFLSVFSVFVGVLFIVQTWSIYRSAPQSPYTVESITAHFQQIALPVWLWVAAIFGNILLAYLYPEKEKHPKAYLDATAALSKTKKILATRGALSKKALAKGKAEQKYRLKINLLCGAGIFLATLLCGLILFGVIYQPLIKTEFFTAHDGVVDKLFQCVLLSVIALATACITARLNANSLTRERVYYLKELADTLQAKKSVKQQNDTAKQVQKDSKKSETRGVWSLRVAIFALAVVLLIVGIFNGGMQEVFLKAINICTQCIGLG